MSRFTKNSSRKWVIIQGVNCCFCGYGMWMMKTPWMVKRTDHQQVRIHSGAVWSVINALRLTLFFLVLSVFGVRLLKDLMEPLICVCFVVFMGFWGSSPVRFSCRVCWPDHLGFNEPTGEETARLHPWAHWNWGEIHRRPTAGPRGTQSQIIYFTFTFYPKQLKNVKKSYLPKRHRQF